jgi:selenide,water dikinase
MAETMWTLNDVAGQAMGEFEAHAATDITGCGLIGHAWEMAHGSQVTIRLYASRVPVFEEALVFARRGYLTQGDVSNRAYTRDAVSVDTGVSSTLLQVMFDPQTSGGLLIALPPSQASALVQALHTRGVQHAVIVGEVEAGGGTITIVP